MSWLILAAAGELVGCYTFLLWWRGGSVWLTVAAAASLLLFVWSLAHAPSPFAGRTYAAYAGVYLIASLL